MCVCNITCNDITVLVVSYACAYVRVCVLLKAAKENKEEEEEEHQQQNSTTSS